VLTNNLYFDLAPTPDALKAKVLEELESGRVGYYHLPKSGAANVAEVREWAKGRDIAHVVIIGVGGSSLGAKAVAGMLEQDKAASTPSLHFLENIDPITTTATLSSIDPARSLFLLISKSGTTLDTISLAKIVMARMGLGPESAAFAKHFAVVTDEGSALHKFADEYHLKSFFIPSNVGGRFSFLSNAGLVPLTLAGYDTEHLVEGAAACVEDFMNDRTTILRKAHRFASSDEHINVLFSYSNIFRGFNDWYVQLWAESLGKEHRGLTPVGLIGAIDQHSFLQLIMEGPRDKSVTFVRVEKMKGDMVIPSESLKYIEKADLVEGITAAQLLNEQALSTMQSVIDAGIATDEIVLAQIDARAVGYLMYYYEILTSCVGAAWGINTYNQPGVEVGKKILLAKLARR
jgi:glucose-6-phosphate isomerase